MMQSSVKSAPAQYGNAPGAEREALAQAVEHIFQSLEQLEDALVRRAGQPSPGAMDSLRAENEKLNHLLQQQREENSMLRQLLANVSHRVDTLVAQMMELQAAQTPPR